MEATLLKKSLTVAALAGLVLPLGLAMSTNAEAKPKWKEGGWSGGPPAWAPAHGWRRQHERWGGGYGYGERQVRYRYGYEPRRYERW